LRFVLLLALLAGVAAALAWPRLNDVETGRTPAYPDLQPRRYTADVAQVSQAARALLGSLPRWRLVGAGSGPGGAELQAVHQTRLWRFEDDVTVRIQRRDGRTVVSVRSRSRVGQWDFGQNARNIRAFLEALDARVR
jgi:uncharacterized protein (DUF1499 family)